MCWACVKPALLATALVAVMLLAACSEPGESPESRVRATIVALQQAIEDGSLNRASDLVHPDYADTRHPDKRAAMQSLFVYLRRHRTLHLFSRVDAVAVEPNAASAQAVLHVAMAGVPVESLQSLVSLRADLYRFELQFDRADDAWLVKGADWQAVDVRTLIEGQ